jgi:hypothetical protein
LPTIDNSIPADLDPSLEWLEVVEQARPDYDESTQKIQKTEGKDAGKWQRSWSVVDLSSAELIANIQSVYTAANQVTAHRGKTIPIDKASLAFYDSVKNNIDGIELPMYLPTIDGSMLKISTKEEALALHAVAKGDALGMNKAIGQAIEEIENGS